MTLFVLGRFNSRKGLTWYLSRSPSLIDASVLFPFLDFIATLVTEPHCHSTDRPFHVSADGAECFTVGITVPSHRALLTVRLCLDFGCYNRRPECRSLYVFASVPVDRFLKAALQIKETVYAFTGILKKYCSRKESFLKTNELRLSKFSFAFLLNSGSVGKGSSLQWAILRRLLCTQGLTTSAGRAITCFLENP